MPAEIKSSLEATIWGEAVALCAEHSARKRTVGFAQRGRAVHDGAAIDGDRGRLISRKADRLPEAEDLPVRNVAHDHLLALQKTVSLFTAPVQAANFDCDHGQHCAGAISATRSKPSLPAHRASGRVAAGGPGFPTLVSTSFLWGGTPEAIAETIRVGINADHPETRVSQMPAFGRDGMLTREQIDDVVDYVRSFSTPSVVAKVTTEKLAAGKSVFTDNCVACHGDNATGSTDVGAPDLADKFWIYGGDAQSVFTTVWGGRQGHMPSWESRLSLLDRKILALYLVDLRRAAP